MSDNMGQTLRLCAGERQDFMTDHEKAGRSEHPPAQDPAAFRAEVRAALRKGGLAAARETLRADREGLAESRRQLTGDVGELRALRARQAAADGNAEAEG